MESGKKYLCRQPPSPHLLYPHSVYFPMPDSPSPNILQDPRDNDFSDFMRTGEDTGEPISVPPPCINANRLSQMTTGSGRKYTRKSGKKRMSGSRYSTSTGLSARLPADSACPNGAPIRYHWEARKVSGLFGQEQHWITRSSSQSPTTIHIIAYWVSVRRVWGMEELSSLASLESVCLND